MSTETPARFEPRATDDDSTDPLDDRTRRILEQHLTVTPDVGRARGADGLVIVTSERVTRRPVRTGTGPSSVSFTPVA